MIYVLYNYTYYFEVTYIDVHVSFHGCLVVCYVWNVLKLFVNMISLALPYNGHAHFYNFLIW